MIRVWWEWVVVAPVDCRRGCGWLQFFFGGGAGSISGVQMVAVVSKFEGRGGMCLESLNLETDRGLRSWSGGG